MIFTNFRSVICHSSRQTNSKLTAQIARLALIIILALLVVLNSVWEAQAQVVTPPPLENSPYDAQTFKIADQLQCPVCQGVTVAYSNSGLAQQMRALIKKKLEQGENQEQILQYFVERYGESILTNPPRSGFTLLVWLLPVIGLLLGAGIVGYVLRGWKRQIYEFATRNRPSPAKQSGLVPAQNTELAEKPPSVVEVSQVPVSAEVLKEYEERVELELSRFAGTGEAGKLRSRPGATSLKKEEEPG